MVLYSCYQVAEVEDVVNDKINKSLPVYAFVAPLEQASIGVDVSVTLVVVVFVLLCSVFNYLLLSGHDAV